MATPCKLDRPLTPEGSGEMMLSFNVKEVEAINALYRTGLYGNSPKAVVQNLIREQLRQHAAPEGKV